MKIILVQLSDIHIKKDKNNPILSKDYLLAKAIASKVSSKLDLVLLLFTGDITFSGEELEYEIAYDFIRRLEDNIRHICGQEVLINSLVLPGNHDCNFSDKDVMMDRDLYLNSIKQEYKDCKDIEKFSIDQRKIDKVVAVQSKFFVLAESIMEGEYVNKLQYVLELKVSDNYKIAIQLLNTAWMSTKKEQGMELFFPLNNITQIDATQYDMVLTAFHHPLVWLENRNRRQLERYINTVSDIVVTGHEHVPDQHYIVTETSNSKYIGGGVLQVNEKDDDSSFNIIIFDIEKKLEKLITFNWRDFIFEEEKSTWNEFLRNRYLNQLMLVNSEYFLAWLNDAGMKFIHPRKDNIYLDDIYILPDIELSEKWIEKEKQNYIQGENIIEYVRNKKRILLEGKEDAGKTSLLKILYKKFVLEGSTCLYINAQELLSGDEDYLEDIICKQFKKQYSDEKLNSFLQESKEKKIIFLDDYYLLQISSKSKEKILEYLDFKFGTIVIVINENYMLTSMYSKNISLLEDYCKISIMEFGYKLRAELIKKWKCIGLEEEIEIDCAEFAKTCRESEANIDVLMSQNLFPKIPQSILMLLQQLETHNQSKQYSKYAQLYEVMIWQQLDMSFTEEDIDMYKTIMSILAYQIYNRNNNSKGIIKEEDIANTLEFYNKEFRMKESNDSLKREMEKANIIVRDGERYYFKYEYIYTYFLSYYMSNNIDDEEVQKHISIMCQKIYKENYSNILLFICHLSGKDKFILEKMLSESKEIFKNNIPYNLKNNYAVVQKLLEKVEESKEYIDISKAIVATNNRKTLLEQKDKIERERMEQKENFESELEDEDNADIIDLNRCFQTLKLLGQLLKNYPGSLKGNYKYDIVKECYELGMRLVDNFMKMLDENLDLLIEIFTNTIFEDNSIRDKEDIKNKTSLIFLNLSKAVSLSAILNIAQSIHSDRLKDIYSDVLLENKTLSNELIDLALKFEMQTTIPYHCIVDLYEEIKNTNNEFAKSILIRLVRRYLYLHPYDRFDIQRVCNELNIPQNIIYMSKVKAKKIS